MTGKPPGRKGPDSEVAALKSRLGDLRQAAALPGADLESLLDAALAELDTAIDALTAVRDPAAGRAGGSSDAAHAERRLLHTVFQQAPVPLFLLAEDGTIRRVNAAAGELLGSGPGYCDREAVRCLRRPAIPGRGEDAARHRGAHR